MQDVHVGQYLKQITSSPAEGRINSISHSCANATQYQYLHEYTVYYMESEIPKKGSNICKFVLIKQILIIDLILHKP